ncbi:MAG: hypothetical protein K2H89_10315 [Oscillospiraceae bacterium]|nr:hypothetical protein [Oscillospiraceae bacterium]
MGVILFVVFTAMEILLTMLSCTKYRSLWYRNRMFFCGAELILVLLVMLLPATGQKWRFTGCLVILGIRLVLSGIVYLVKHSNATKEKTKAGTIAGAVMSIILIGFSLFPAFIFTGYSGLKTSGQYEVKETQAILIDKSRLETHETDGSNREIPVHFYYPADDASNCPLVLFAHGSFGYYQSNSSLYAELASNGYVVASIDHPYYAFFTKDTEGKTIIVDMEFMQTAVDMQNNSNDFTEADYNIECEWMSLRTADENFVLDTIKTAKDSGLLDTAWYTESENVKAEILKVLEMTDTERIGLTGHSIGGATAVQLGRERDDITAVVDIDGTMLGEYTSCNEGKLNYNPEPYPIPILSLDNERHWGSYVNEPDEETEYVNKYLLDNAIDGREAHFDGTEHMDFTDLPLFAPVLAKNLGKGDVDSSEFIPEMNSMILNYFNYYLKGEGEPNIASWNAQTAEN